MNATDQTHPSREELTAYLAGKLNAVESDNIKQHLAACDTCCDLVDSLPADDTIIAALREQEAETSVSSDVDSAKVIAPTITPEAEDGTQAVRGQTTKVAGLGADQLNLPAELRDHPRYRIVELLGHGGMGDVYRAEHKVMNRQVALKVIKPQLVQNDAAVRRFQREVQAAAQLRHPNIVTAFDAEQAGDLHYLVMEFVNGEDLDEVIRRDGSLSVEDACSYIRQAAEGLQHANDLGMVHRDIKPHNLMIEKQTGTMVGDVSVVKILDFGLANFATETAEEELGGADDFDEPGQQVPENTVPGASILHQLTQMGTMMGTPDYIAPEQAQDAHTADIHSDIYSLGCTFYTLLSGQAPFGEGSIMDKVKAHTENTAPPLSEFRDDVPEEVEAVVNKMLAKDPADRYQTPAEVAEALAQCSPDAPRPEKRVSESPAYRKRRPLVLTAVATLLLAIIAAAVVFYIQTDNGKPLTIRAGEQQLIVRQKDSDFELITDSFQLRRGDRVALKVDLLPGEVVVSKKDGTRLGAKPLPLDQLVAQEWERLEGRWQAIDGQQEGAPLDPEEVGGLQLVIKDRKMTFYDHGRADPGVADIQPTANPKQLDIAVRTVVASSDGRSTSAFPSTILGIYKLDGDRLTICLAEDGKPRPKVFDTQPALGGGAQLMVLRRQDTSESNTGENEIRVVYDHPNGKEVLVVDGERFVEAVNGLTRIREQFSKNPKLTVILDAGPEVDRTAQEDLMIVDRVRMMLAATGAPVRLSPNLAADFENVRQRGERLNALKQTGPALHSYHDVRKFFPPGPVEHNPTWFDENGQPHLSWRVHILPYLEQAELYRKFKLDEPWDSEHNKPLLAEMPPQFKTTDEPTQTTLLAVVGDGTIYEGKSGLSLKDIKDGWANTAYVVDAGRERAVPWTKPEDLPFDTEDPIRAFGTSDFGDVFLALMVDGSVKSIPHDTAPESLRALFTRAAGDKFDATAKRTTPLPQSVRPKQADGITAVHEFSDPKSFVRDVAFSPNGRLTAAVSDAGRLFVWEIDTRKMLIQKQAAPQFRSVAFSPEGRRLVASGGPQAWVWDLLNPDEKEKLDFDGDKIDDCVFLSEEICAGVVDGGTVHTFRSDNGFPLYTVSAGSPLAANDSQWFAVYRPDAIAAHAAETGELLRTFKAGAFQPMWRLGMTGGGFKLAAGSQAGDVIVWEADTGKQVHRMRAHVGRSCIGGFSAFGKRLASHGDDGMYRVWDLEFGKQIRSFPFGAQGAWTHYNMRSKFLDNTRLLFVDASDVIHIWDVEEDREIARHQAPENSTRDIAVSPSGEYLLTGGGFSELSGELEDTGDYKVRLWQLPQ